MGVVLSILQIIVRSEKRQVCAAIDVAEEAMVEVVHEVADCAEELVEEL